MKDDAQITELLAAWSNDDDASALERLMPLDEFHDRAPGRSIFRRTEDESSVRAAISSDS